MTRENPEPGKVREAVGVFGDTDDLNKAVAELEATAFPRESLSILGTKEALHNKFGDFEIFPEILEDNPDAPRNAIIMPEERALGAAALIGGGAYLGAIALAIAVGSVTFPAVAIGALLGAGIGTAVVAILGDRYHAHIRKQVQKGGLLLWVHTNSPTDEDVACEILKKHHAQHVHVHEIA